MPARSSAAKASAAPAPPEIQTSFMLHPPNALRVLSDAIKNQVVPRDKAVSAENNLHMIVQVGNLSPILPLPTSIRKRQTGGLRTMGERGIPFLCFVG